MTADPDADTPPSAFLDASLAEASILIVDDEPGMRNFLVKMLAPRCRLVDVAADTAEATTKLEGEAFDVIILDNVMRGGNGIDWLAEQRSAGLFADVILMTAYADLDTAIEALRAGAADFVLKPFRSNQLLNAIARCLDRSSLRRENGVLRHALGLPLNRTLDQDRLIGDSEAIQAVRAAIARVAPLPTSVLLTGESGTGKEVAARSLHAQSPRAGRMFVPINCAAMSPDTIEGDLFGRVEGASGGAATPREGLFLYAQGGTIFLDNIGDLPLALQSKLLRVLEDRRVRPVGAERETPFDARFVFAADADLSGRVEAGLFRADLYFRIDVLAIRLPPLRERGDDVVRIAELFMQEASQGLGLAPVRLDARAQRLLKDYDWPGNVRELRNLIERTVILGEFPARIAPLPGGETAEPVGDALADVERRHILAVLHKTGGNREEAARRLGVSRKTIDRKCQSWRV